MYGIVVGCGRVGARVATSLSADGHDVAVVDQDPDAFQNLGVAFNGLTVAGTGIDADILRKAGVEKADSLAAATSNDSVNLMVAQLAKEVFGVPRVASRINEPDREDIFREFGLATVCPTNLGAAQLKSELFLEGVQVRQTLGAGEIVVVEIIVADQNVGRKISELEIQGKVRVCALVRNGVAYIPRSEDICASGDQLVATARLDALNTLGVIFGSKGRK